MCCLKKKYKQLPQTPQYKCLRKHQYYIGNIIHYKILFFIKTICFKHKRDMWPSLLWCYYQITQIQSNAALGTALRMCHIMPLVEMDRVPSAGLHLVSRASFSLVGRK